MFHPCPSVAKIKNHTTAEPRQNDCQHGHPASIPSIKLPSSNPTNSHDPHPLALEIFWLTHCRRGARSRRAAGGIFRLSRAKWCGQNHDHQDARGAAKADGWHSHRRRLRCAARAGEGKGAARVCAGFSVHLRQADEHRIHALCRRHLRPQRGADCGWHGGIVRPLSPPRLPPRADGESLARHAPAPGDLQRAAARAERAGD